MSADIIARLEKLTGPDREVDRVIDHVVFWPNEAPRNLEISIRDEWDVPTYTASIDAAVALVERVLPGCGVSIERHPVYGDWWDAAIFDQTPKTIANARKQTAALAVCLALLRALEAEGARDV